MILEKYPGILYAVSQASDGNMSLVRCDPDEALHNREKFISKIG